MKTMTKTLGLLWLAVMMTFACGKDPAAPAPHDPFSAAFVDVRPLAATLDTMAEFLIYSTYVPALGISNQWIIGDGTHCYTAFYGNGFAGINQFTVAVVPVHIYEYVGTTDTPWRGQIGGSNATVSAADFRSGRISLSVDRGGNQFTTFHVDPVTANTGYVATPTDPFATPFAAPWGRDADHLTAWKLSLNGASPVYPTTMPFAADTISSGELGGTTPCVKLFGN